MKTGMWSPTDEDLLRALEKRKTAMAQSLLRDLDVPRSRNRNDETEYNPIWRNGAVAKRMDALVDKGLATKSYNAYGLTASGKASLSAPASDHTAALVRIRAELQHADAVAKAALVASLLDIACTALGQSE